MWALWLLSQPPERGGLGFDPISARKLTIEAALFYLSSEEDIKARCRYENKLSQPAEATETALDKLRAEKIRLRLKYTGSEEL